VRTARATFPDVDRVSDEPSVDLLTQRMQVQEKNAWMLRSGNRGHSGLLHGASLTQRQPLNQNVPF
jgi:hypothetical protein